MVRIFKKLLSKIPVMLCALFTITPFYILIVYAVKSKQDMALTKLAFPTSIYWDNFTKAAELSNFSGSLRNSIITTIPVVVILVLICPAAAYAISRNGKGRFYNVLYYIMLSAMMLPFQAIMLPLYVNLKSWSLMNTIGGYVLAQSSFLIPITIIITAGFVKTIPIDIEEAGLVDGLGVIRCFWKIVFPLMRPIILTCIVLNFLNTWNDFKISLIILQNNALRTIPLTQFFFFGEHAVELNLAFAACLLSILPAMAIYFLLQKYIIAGIVAGAVKG